MANNEKKDLFLHIGTHKTGSTAIQDYLFGNRDLLLKQGFYYPCEGSYYFHGERSQSLLAHSLLNQRPEYLGHKMAFDRDQCISDIRRDISASGCQNIIISSEHFSLASTVDQWQAIQQLFMPVVDKIRVIVYLRRQDTRLESQWAQNVKSGKITDSFDEFKRRSTRHDYFRFLELISRVFGKRHIIVRPYEFHQLHQGCVVMDFLEVVGVKGHAPISAKLNRAPPVDRLQAIRLINRHFDSYEMRRVLGRIVQSLDLEDDQTKYSLFTAEERHAFLESFRQSNSLVARHFLNRDDGMLFQESEENNAPVYPGLTAEKLASILAPALIVLAAKNRQLLSELTLYRPEK